MYDLAYFIGCSFKDGGRGTEIDPVTKKPFYDCYGLFIDVFKHIYGIELPDVIVSCFDVLKIYRLFKENVLKWRRIEIPTEPCGVALCVDPRHPKIVCHFGVYVGKGRFIHILDKTKSILSNIHDPYYSRCIEGFYRYEG